MSDQSSKSFPVSAAELMLWYKHAGVDIALQDNPVDQFALFKQQSKTRQNSVTDRAGQLGQSRPQIDQPTQAKIRRNTPMPETAIPDENTVKKARERAEAAGSLDELREIMAGFKGCNLHLSAKNMVFADGNPASGIMIIGEAPGREEDMHGLPFVGRSGQLLDRMLAAIGLDRDKVYLSNIIPWRPPGNRTPTPLEIEICRPFIERHITLASPGLIILLGGAAAKILLETQLGIVKLRGRWKKYPMAEHQIDTITTFHPDNLLAHPTQKKLAWQDLLKIKQKLAND
ncbi:MAG: uracil-DNA glycosylase [Hyphomicrobiales bacterium]|nr:uracil-DNA glycosylase [Hyphomicrobiales bacterium]